MKNQDCCKRLKGEKDRLTNERDALVMNGGPQDEQLEKEIIAHDIGELEKVNCVVKCVLKCVFKCVLKCVLKRVLKLTSLDLT